MTILQGDVRETLKTLPSDSVHCVVTSPPYWNLRSYLPKDHALKSLEIGSEATLEQYLITMLLVFREIRRVLHSSGTLWLNIGSTYASASTRSTRLRQAARVPTCGSDGKEPQDSPKPDCACPGRDGGLQGDSENHRSHTARICQPGEQSVEPAEQTARDSVPTDSACAAAPSHAVQPSTNHASIPNGPVASCPEGIVWEPRTAGGSSPDDVPQSVHTGQNTGGTLSQLRTLVDHIEDKEPLDLACAYCSIVSRGIKEKDLLNVPSMLAEALRLDGWFIRSDIAWCKKSPMPESVTDRPTSAWEHIWLLSKSARYFWDADAVRQPHVEPERSRPREEYTESHGPKDKVHAAAAMMGRNSHRHREYNPAGASLRNFWLLGPEPYSEAHFATFPSEIPKRAILAGTSARGCCPKCLSPWERVVETTKTFQSGSGRSGNRIAGKQNLAASSTNTTPDVRMGPCVSTRTLGWQPTCTCDAGDPIPCLVLDPFAGTGCTLMVAIELGRRAIGCELNPAYIAMIRDRTNVTPGLPLA